jgi:hypothetical protein
VWAAGARGSVSSWCWVLDRLTCLSVCLHVRACVACDTSSPGDGGLPLPRCRRGRAGGHHACCCVILCYASRFFFPLTANMCRPDHYVPALPLLPGHQPPTRMTRTTTKTQPSGCRLGSGVGRAGYVRFSPSLLSLYRSCTQHVCLYLCVHARSTCSIMFHHHTSHERGVGGRVHVCVVCVCGCVCVCVCMGVCVGVYVCACACACVRVCLSGRMCVGAAYVCRCSGPREGVGEREWGTW